jgi:PGAP1-like protein
MRTSLSSSKHHSIQVQATTTIHDVRIPKNVQLLILPGFGNAANDYRLPYGSSFAPTTPTTTTPSTTTTTNNNHNITNTSPFHSGSLVQSLIRRGWDPSDIVVLPMERIDWLQVFVYGCFDIQFWQGTAPPTNPAFVWYLNRIRTTLQQMRSNSRHTNSSSIPNDNQVVLIGHSAGGWLGRAALGYICQQEQASSLYPNICGVVTLGAPHVPPPSSDDDDDEHADGDVGTAMDMTRGALRYTHKQYPGAYQHYYHYDNGSTSLPRGNVTTMATSPVIFYITVCGQSVRGIEAKGTNLFEPTTMAGFAYNSYKAVCGNGNTIGDGTTLDNVEIQFFVGWHCSYNFIHFFLTFCSCSCPLLYFCTMTQVSFRYVLHI